MVLGLPDNGPLYCAQHPLFSCCAAILGCEIEERVQLLELLGGISARNKSGVGYLFCKKEETVLTDLM